MVTGVFTGFTLNPEPIILSRSGGALGDKLICHITIKSGEISGMDKEVFLNGNIRSFIRDRMRDVYDKLYRHIKDKLINWYVPKDTGALRRSMEYSISKAYSVYPDSSLTMTMFIFANKDYAVHVNKMETHKTGPDPAVQHPFPAKWKAQNTRRGRVLDDPHAVGPFFQFILVKARNRAAEYIKDLVREVRDYINLQGYNFTYSQIKSIFTIRPWNSVGRKI